VTDPRRSVEQLSDEVPFVLLPVRLETRFRDADGSRPRLLVRIYPDTCAIDTFEALPSETELRNAREYWEATWAAGGVEEEERAAWNALVAAHGSGRAAYVARQLRPLNEAERPRKGARPVFPADVETKSGSWSQAPKVHVMPDRFVLVATSGTDRIEALGEPIPSPLIVGPDPSAPPERQLRPERGELRVPDEMRWLVDFERAVEWGLGFDVGLTPAQAKRGIDRLRVLGVRQGASEAEAQSLLEELLRHHQDGPSGFSLLPQGTATNNTEETAAGLAAGDDVEESFDAFAGAPLFKPVADPLAKRDGQWLAELLGIRPAVLEQTLHADGTDQVEARAMQVALWPATLGYFLETMMEPLAGDADVDAARAFFVRHVSGRGPAPAIRIGRQPYGVLATTAFSRMRWLDRQPPFLRRLAAMLDVADQDWRALSGGVAFAGRAGDPHATLLEILGLHPSSVEFHQRYAQSREHVVDHLALGALGDALNAALAAAGLDQPAIGLLARLGHPVPPRPAILDRYFLDAETELGGDVVDDRPLSETAPIRTWASGERNYVRWLIDAAAGSLEVLRRQTGFVEDRPPTALLYLLLRHALLLGYYDAGYRLHRSARVLAPAALAEMRREPAFVHVASGKSSESRWSMVYGREPRITGSPTRTLAEHIADVLPTAPEAAQLREQLAALERLADVPTARLERAFAEHVDCCGYRFDAWRLGLVSFQLDAMRSPAGGGRGRGGGARQGLHLGAYGWLEDIRPKSRTAPGGGYVHAPSLDHAATAAILRAGHLANRTAENPDTLAVNLSPARVRQALALLEGVREGQSLGALLGYRLERGLHDGHDLAEVDHLVFALRKEFPLRADRLEPTRTDPDVPIDAIEARNVVDGLLLVEHIKTLSAPAYPWGKQLPAATPAQAAAVDAEVARLLDLHDALSDLALAEGVHQAVLGNYDRVAATLDASGKGGHPPDPEVVRTPSRGTGLTHRVGLHLQPGAAAPDVHRTPRSAAEPALNAWLASVLPPLDRIACRVEWTDPATGGPAEATVTMADLELQPIDLLALVRPDGDEVMTELDDRVVRHVVDNAKPRPDAALAVRYMDAPGAMVSLFEASALIAPLRTLVTAARPLRPSDLTPPQQATRRADATMSVDAARIAAVRDELAALRPDLDAFLAGLEGTDAIAGVDGLVDDAVDLLARAARFGIPQTGWSFAYVWRREQYAGLVRRVAELVEGWNARIARFEQRLADYDALPAETADAERFRLLRQAELEVATAIADPPATPAELRASLPARLIAFEARRDELAALPGTAMSLAGLIAAIEDLLPVSDLVADPFSIDDEKRRVAAFGADLEAIVASLAGEVQRRVDAADERLAAHDPVAAAKALLGEDFVVIPEFTLEPDQAREWREALDASDTTLLRHLNEELGVEEPVDEWLYGVARVRPPMRVWEEATLLAGGFGRAEPELTPAQLPHRPGEPWLAMQFPQDHAIDGERLLYTAHHSVPFDAEAAHCGLLLDEWTEVIPAAAQETGVAFNFDRPSAEAPQSILLVTPATWDGSWHWDDLVGALDDTLALAKQRAVEPDQIDATPYARFLPATLMAAAASDVSIGTTLALNNDVLKHMEPAESG
jgi:hypothetical protein